MLEGGGTEINQDLGSCCDQLCGGINTIKGAREVLGRPEILADRDADSFSGHLNRRRGAAGFKVTGLVKDIIGGKQSLMDDQRCFIFLEKCCCIEEGLAPSGFIPVDEPDHKRHAAKFTNRIMQLGQDRDIPIDEFPGKNQVERRLAGKSQLRCEHQLRSLHDQILIGTQDECGIPRKIPDCRIDLGQSEIHTR